MIGVSVLVTISFFSGCINLPEELTQFSIVSFDVEPGVITKGGYANLSWVVIAASSVSIDHGTGSVALTGHRLIQPVQTTTYTLTASNATKTKNATVTIIVRNETNVEPNRIAVVETTMGTIKIELCEDKAPVTTKNFIDHANNGYYDGVIFHRVIADFMIQGGDPNGDGTNGHAAEYHEGYGDPADPSTWVIPDEFHPDLSNVRGTISMANRGPNTGGSQFFINVVDNTYLDYNKEPVSYQHAVFGYVIEGMNVVDAISLVDTGGDTKPEVDVIISTITILSP